MKSFPSKFQFNLLLAGVIFVGPPLSAMAAERLDAVVGNASVDAKNVTERLRDAGYEPESINLQAPPSDQKLIPDEVVLANGDILRGRISSEDESILVLEHPVFKTLKIPRDTIVAIRRAAHNHKRTSFGAAVAGAGVRTPNTPQPKKKPAAAEPNKLPNTHGLEALLLPDTWTFVLGTAFGYVQNVNNEYNLRLSAQASHQSEFARLRIESAYFLNSSNNEIIDNDILVSTTQDWLLPDSKWSLFAKGTYQWDEFEGWEHRVSGYVGPGYQLINEENLIVDMRVGVGVTYEYGVPQTLPEALVSAEWSWTIDDRQRFNGAVSYVPDISEPSQFRLELNAEWNFRLQKEEGLSFYVGVRNQYQSIVPDNSTNNDLRLFGGVKYEF